ncbi:MAG: hypothetical protein R3E12_01545 [Candidatus Eisenbacteria bacterium]|uniref:Uncharacterized protein n=1 Tax=Eiseniibacteriota bacterium TaxID=2212470 RepID=A0A956LVY3_UNCEI|nr:hypothetical protein [Candidatus Eisenbacteria bacterium]
MADGRHERLATAERTTNRARCIDLALAAPSTDVTAILVERRPHRVNSLADNAPFRGECRSQTSCCKGHDA